MKSKKRALITGVSGQDGSYLAELLLSKGYEVHGIVRREALEDSKHRLRNIVHIMDQLTLHIATLTDHLSLYRIIQQVKPDECYHLAAASFVNYSLDDEFLILNQNFNSTHYLLSSILELAPACRVFFAGSSELFGNPKITPQNEETKFNPKSIYGISKAASYFLINNYREKENMYACTGIMYNHESPRRGHQFVTRKITHQAAMIKLGLVDRLKLGNLDALRDWGYAPEYVEAIWLMLQQDSPNDYILATGKLHSVRQFLEIAFGVLDLDYQKYVEVDPQFFRPAEKIPLCGDPSKIKNDLGWQTKTSLETTIYKMVENDLAICKQQNYIDPLQ